MSPNRATAAARAASALMPRSMYSRVRISTWKANSASTSCSTLAFQRSDASWRWVRPSVATLRAAQEHRHGARALRPFGGFGLQLFPSARREPIELCFAAELRGAPLGVDPALALHAVERGIERALFARAVSVVLSRA